MREPQAQSLWLSRARSNPWVFSLVILGFALACPEQSYAQKAHPAVTTVDQTIEDLFSQAARFERQGKFDQAAKTYLRAQDALVERRRKNSQRRFVTKVNERLDWGLERAIADRIQQLPDAGKKAYLLVVEPRAQASLSSALKSRKLDDLKSLIQRYPLAPSTIKAMRLLADLALEDGRVDLAASTYIRLSQVVPKERALFLRRAALTYSIVKDNAGLRFVSQEASRWKLQKDKGLAKILKLPRTQEPKALPVLGKLGRLERSGDLSRPEMSASIESSFKSLPPYQIPVVQRVKDEVFVYVSDAKTIRAYRLSESLRKLWDFTVGGPDAQPERLEVMRMKPEVVGDTVFVTLNRNRPAQRLEKAKGKNGEGAEDEEEEKDDDKKDDSRDPDDAFEIQQEKNWRMVALDRKTGKVRWDLADKEGFDRFSRNSEWISSPTYADGHCYVTATIFDNELQSFLIKINAQSGELAWVAELASRTPANHRGLGGPLFAPMVREGVVYVATGLGLLAAVDSHEGFIRWAYHYPVFPDRSQSTIIDEDRRFDVSPPQILKSQDLVVLAPVDGPYVIALDRRSGRLRWKHPRGRARFVEVDRDQIVLAGDRVEIIDGATGLVRVRSPKLVAPAAYRPLLGQSAMIVPTTKGFVRLSKQSLAQESVFEVWNKNEVGALLSLNDQRFLSVSPRRFNIYGSVKRVLREYDRPGTYSRWFERGKLYERRGQYQKSASAYAQALKTSTGKNDPDLRLQASKSLFLVLWRFVEERYETDKGATFSELAPQMLSVARKTESMAEASGTKADQEFLYKTALFKKRLGAVLADRGSFKDALSAVEAQQSLLDRRTRLKLDHEGVKVDSKAYATEQLKALIAKHGPKVYAKQEEKAGALGREAIQNKSNDSMIAIIARYPVSKMAAELRYQLAKYYNERFLHSLSTEALETFLQEYPKDPRAAQAMALLAETLKKRNRHHDAKRVALELLNRFQGDMVRDGDGRKIEVRDFVRALLDGVQKIRDPMALAMRDRCADLRKPLNRSFRLEMDLNGMGTKSLEVGPYEPLQHFFLKRSQSLEARLVDGGLLSWSIPCQMDFEERRTPLATRGTLAVPFDDEVQGVDIVSGGLLWKYRPKALGKKKIFVGNDAIASLRVDKQNVYVLSNEGELACLDAVTGKVQWKSLFNARLAGLLETRSDRVLVATNLPAGVTVLNTKTGKIVKRVPLSKDLRSEHRGPMLTTKRGVIALVGRHHLVGYNFDTDRLLFERRVASLGSIKRLSISKDERYFFAVGTQLRSDISSMVAMNCVTGVQMWSDDGRGRMKGFGRKYGHSTKIKQLYCGDRALYSVRREGLEKTQIWAQDLTTGAQKWVWRCPPGQGPQMVIETPGQLIVPYGGQLGRCSLSIIAKGSGQTIDTYRIPGRKVVSTAVAAGTLLVMTDRGQFAFARVKEDLVARDVVEMLELFKGKKKVEPLLAALIADRLQKSGTIDPAVELLAKSLLSESLSQKDFRLLYSKLVTLLEMQIEKSQPKMNIQRMSRPAEIDGDLNDWYRQWSAVSTAGPVHVLPIQGMPGGEGEFWRGQEDLSAKLYMAYDDKNFYFALDVRDQDLRPYDSEAKRWIGDCLLIAIDCKNDGGQWYSRDDILLSLALTRPRKKKKKDQDPKDPKKGEKEKNRPSGKYFVKRKEDHSGVIYECKIPWSMFEKYGVRVPKAGPPKGFTFGFNFVLTDDDGGRRGDGKNSGALKALSWTPSLRLHADKSRVWQGYIPEYFGKVTLD